MGHSPLDFILETQFYFYTIKINSSNYTPMLITRNKNAGLSSAVPAVMKYILLPHNSTSQHISDVVIDVDSIF